MRTMRTGLAGLLSVAAILAMTSAPAAAAPRIRWHQCPKAWKVEPGWQCGWLKVPLDYAKPRKAKIRLNLARLPATGKRLGSVFFNPGGPGASGIASADSWAGFVGPAVRASYDLVTWDPRGVQESKPRLHCETMREAEKATDAAVMLDREMKARMTTTALEAKRCAQRAAKVVRQISTLNNVRDLDRMRAAVGDKKLSYVGISYGTGIGAVYSSVYPRRYRAIVLHGTIDSTVWFKRSFGFVRSMGVEYQKNLAAGLDACDAAPKACAFAGGARAKFKDVLTAAKAESSRDRNSKAYNGLVDMANAIVGIDKKEAAKAAQTLQKIYLELKRETKTSGEVLDPLSDLGERPDEPHLWVRPGGNGVNQKEVRDATICSDHGRLPRSPARWISEAKRALDVAPVFGPFAVMDQSMCAQWRTFGPRFKGSLKRGKAPILVLNQRWDYATPLSWAQRVTAALSNARLVTIDGFGHGIETPCSTGHVSRYLLTRRLPADSPVCADGAAISPF